jgi:hypothetical protein
MAVVVVGLGCQTGNVGELSKFAPNPTPTVSTCDAPQQILDPASFVSCGPTASCVPAVLLEANEPGASEQLSACDGDATTRCVPNAFFVMGNAFDPIDCTSIGGSEGRCVDMVVPEVEEGQLLLPQSTCAASERCVPCTTPTGRDTGVCALGCDEGPKLPATTFLTCENGAGVCVPAADVPVALQESLDNRDCDDETAFCIPNETFDPATIQGCSGELPGDVGPYVGVYLNSEILNVDNQGFFDEDPNRENFSCYPCFNPGEPTRPPTGLPGCARLYPNGEPPLPPA